MKEFTIGDCLLRHGIECRGIIHVGAGMLEEASTYHALGFKDVIWVEANPEGREKREALAAVYGHKMITQALGRYPEERVPFFIASNGVSSSLKKMETHREHYPEVVEVGIEYVSVMPGDFLFLKNESALRCNVLSVDVQGTEYNVLLGLLLIIKLFDCIYVEVYTEPLYAEVEKISTIDDFLYQEGFLRIDTWIKKGEGWGEAFYIKRALL